ncbi:MAG TPA: YgjV family protein [Arenibaculum sp.]|nr:YgjV family protein [Arenibaculum sp.]
MSTDMFPLASLFGLAGVAFGASWGLFRTKRSIITIQTGCTFSFLTHYLLLGASSGAAMNVLNLVQLAVAFSGRRGPVARTLYWSTLPAVAVLTVLTWSGPASLGAAFGMTMATLARWQTDMLRLRLFFVLCIGGWATHNAIVGSPFGLTTDAIGLSTNLWGLYLLVRERRHAARPPVPIPTAAAV